MPMLGELGELWVKGPNITPGYWNRPDANASSFTDGWLHTGDAARVDEEGFYYIVDRWKDMYISGGENVYPAEVENVLHQLTAIAEAAVIGIPDAQWGEVGMAIVAVKPGQSRQRGRDIGALRRQSGPLQVPAPDPVRRRAAAQRHRQDPQADLAEEFFDSVGQPISPRQRPRDSAANPVHPAPTLPRHPGRNSANGSSMVRRRCWR